MEDIEIGALSGIDALRRRRESAARVIYEYPSELYAFDAIRHDHLIKRGTRTKAELVQVIVWAKQNSRFRRILPWAYLALMLDEEAKSSARKVKKSLVKVPLPEDDKQLILEAYHVILITQCKTTYLWLLPDRGLICMPRNIRIVKHLMLVPRAGLNS